MFSKLFVSLAMAASALAQITINTPPSLVQCQVSQISWTGGTSPFTLSAIPGGQSSAPAIEFIASGLTASPYPWTVNLATGLNITIKINDGAGNVQYTSPLVIQSGPSNACLNASASTSGVSTGAVTTTGSGSAAGSSSTAAGSSTMMSSMTTTMAMSSATGASGASSTLASATSAAASATSKAGALPTAVAAIPAMALAAVGGVIALF